MSVELIVNFVFALVGIIAFIGMLPALMRWVQNNPRFQRLRGPGRRLDIVEAKMIDTRRRLVIIRRDNKEHLLLIGGETDLVIETGFDDSNAPAATDSKPSSRTRDHDHPA